MKIDKNLKFRYGVKDFQATKQKHQKTIDRMNKTDLKFEDILDSDSYENIALDVCFPSGERGSLWFSYIMKPKILERGKVMQNHINSLRTAVNGRTREIIKRLIVAEGYPKSWDTAFYIKYYNKINKLMIRATKTIIKDYI